MEGKSLLFVYNADSGLFSELKDYVHKMVAPESYGCNLCRITFGATGMKEEWKHFIENLDIDVEFLHIDEIKKLHPEIRAAFPAAFIRQDGDLSLLISDTEINRCSDLDELMELVQKKTG